MSIEHVFFLTPKGSTREAGRDWKAVVFLTWLVFSFTGCVQQSDLVKMGKNFEGKITELDQEKKALAQVLRQANQDIAASRTALAKQKVELNELMNEFRKARAQLKSELRSLREENLPKVSDDLETQLHHLNQAHRKVDDLAGQVRALEKLRKQRDAELSNQVTALGQSLETTRQSLEKALKRMGQKVRAQFAEFQSSLVQFKEALTEVDKRLGEERKRATSSETKIRQDVDKRQHAFRAKLASDTQVLKTYLETEVKTAIESLNTVLHDGHRNLKTDIAAQVTRLSEINAKLGTALAGLRQTDTRHSKNLAEVTQSLSQLRDVLETTGTQLGTKLDSQGKETAQRIKQLQSQYQMLAKKLDTDMKVLQGHLDKEVRPSLESIAKAFGQEKSLVSEKLITLKAGLQHVEQTTASNVTQTQTQLDAQAKHVQELGESVAAMREVLDSMAGMLGQRSDQQMNQMGQFMARMERLEEEQSSRTAKQASNTQAVSTHLNQVTTSVQAVGESFEQFKTTVSTRLNEQAARLQTQAQQVSESLGAASAIPSLQQELQANVKQLNDLTKSVTQLKDVVKAMGDKLSSKVDEHESQLIEVEQILTNFREPAPPNPRSP